ncbi:hypothetical protein GJAV_G00205890 [Gymnothorax javanicus]|nr:hypothetical protein GJAV_G00205890 [Gymnothorax javanicus]
MLLSCPSLNWFPGNTNLFCTCIFHSFMKLLPRFRPVFQKERRAEMGVEQWRCPSNKQRQKVVVVGIPNPFMWFRTRIYYFLIRAYFDKEFNIEDFTEGAKQAFSLVSRLLSESKFDALEGLVANDLIGKLEEKCAHLSPGLREALSAELDEIMYTTPGDVGIYYDDSGRKFVSILMRFWYLTSAKLPDQSLEGARVFQVAIGREEEVEPKRMLTANYEFQREFTQGVTPDWTITRIEHSKLLD